MIGFGKFGKRGSQAVEITTLTDKRLVRINPQEEGFYDAVLNFKSDIISIIDFIEAIKEVKDEKLEAFYKPVYDPSEDDTIVVYQKGNKPATGHSYNWWTETASKMPAVEGKNWKIATEYQYYAFLVWLINRLVKSGKSVEEAINQVVNNSKELGHYYDSEKEPVATGNINVCGVYDLANTYKFLKCSNNVGGFWLGGGGPVHDLEGNPLADLRHFTNVGTGFNKSVGMLVL